MENNYSLYQVRGINNDFIGEWHTNLKECNDELTANNIPNKKSPKIKKYIQQLLSFNKKLIIDIIAEQNKRRRNHIFDLLIRVATLFVDMFIIFGVSA